MKPGGMRVASSPSRRRGRLARAEVEVGGRGDLARRAPRRRAGRPPRPRRSGRWRAGTWPPRRACRRRRRRAPRRRGARRSSARRLDQQGRAVAERERGVAVRRADDGPLARGARSRAAAAGARPARCPRAPRRRAGGPRARRSARPRPSPRRRRASRDVGDDQRAAVGLGQERLGVRAGERRPAARLGRRSMAAQRGDRLVAAGVVRRAVPDQAQAPAAGGSSMPTPSRCAARRSRELDRALGERRLRVAAERGSRPARAAARRARSASITSAGRDAVARQQVADEPRAGELARDVVLQVGVQAAVARVELRRRADREHGGVEQVEPERAPRPRRAGRRRPRPSRRA